MIRLLCRLLPSMCQMESLDMGKPALVREFVTSQQPTADTDFIRRTKVKADYPANRVPLLATCTYVGGAYVRRLLEKIDFPVDTLLIVQDGDQQSVIDAVDSFITDSRTRGSPYVRNIRHIVDRRHLGSVGCFNAVIRLYPSHAFWPTIADDLYFESGALGRFYKELLRVKDNQTVGGVAAQIRRPERRYPGPPELDGVRPTFGCMAWANTRAGILEAGLYDENFYPHYYDDTDHVFRMYLAGLSFYAVNGAIAYHGNASEAETNLGRSTGNAAAELVASSNGNAGSFSDQRSRANTKAHFLFKWGRGVGGFSFSLDGLHFSFNGRPEIPVSVYKTWCAHNPLRYCSPYNGSVPLWYWQFSASRRNCTLSGRGARKGADPCPMKRTELPAPGKEIGPPLSFNHSASTSRSFVKHPQRPTHGYVQLLNGTILPSLLQSLGRTSILMYGCSLDRFMLDWLCNSRGGSVRKWLNSTSSNHEKVSMCVHTKDEMEILYVFNPGASAPPYFANVSKPDVQYWARRLLSREPSVVVVDDTRSGS